MLFVLVGTRVVFVLFVFVGTCVVFVLFVFIGGLMSYLRYVLIGVLRIPEEFYLYKDKDKVGWCIRNTSSN